ncbi:hypothetical protein C6P98_13940 [Burkholderia multivorans]|uniref:Uncharacterized protein n=1 Tax=Burkholderia multivorans TaxID=87883 RepID=A0A8E2RVF1_9BURK|nr:hypothetical protein C6P98_13940 [Burkholderia multivorans]
MRSGSKSHADASPDAINSVATSTASIARTVFSPQRVIDVFQRRTIIHVASQAEFLHHLRCTLALVWKTRIERLATCVEQAHPFATDAFAIGTQ